MQYYKELQYDIKNGASIDEILKAYPELGGDKKLVGELHYDIKNGATQDEVGGAYPELSDNKGGFINGVKEAGSEIASGLREFGSDVRKVQTNRLDETKGLLGKTIKAGGENVDRINKFNANAEQGSNRFGDKAVFAGLSTVRTGLDIGGEALMSGLKTAAPKSVEEKTKEVITSAANSGIGKSIISGAKTGAEKVNKFAATSPQAANLVAAGTTTGIVGSEILGGGALSKGSKVIPSTIKSGTDKGMDAIKIAGNTAKNKAIDGNRAVINMVKPLKDKVPVPSKKGVQAILADKADNLSTNINRMNASQIKKFKQQNGVSPGKFLNDRGITVTGDKLVSKLEDNLKASRAEADKAYNSISGRFKAPKEKVATSTIDKITGKYKNKNRDPIEIMLKDNLDNATSKGSVKASQRNKELLEKYREGGLEIKEINEGKRYLAENNKFGYFTDDTSPRKGFVTQLDSDVRKFMLDTAEKQGVNGINDINKQTQAYYKLMEGIGQWQDKIEGNNPIGLTDYLAFTADPSLFIGKKIGETGLVRKNLLKGLNKVAGRSKSKEVKGAIFKKLNNDSSLNNNIRSRSDDSLVSTKLPNKVEKQGLSVSKLKQLGVKEETISNIMKQTGVSRKRVLEIFKKYGNDVNKMDEMIKELLKK